MLKCIVNPDLLSTKNKTTFKSRLEAIDWIAIYTEDEGAYEVLREQLNFTKIILKQRSKYLPGGL